MPSTLSVHAPVVPCLTLRTPAAEPSNRMFSDVAVTFDANPRSIPATKAAPPYVGNDCLTTKPSPTNRNPMVVRRLTASVGFVKYIAGDCDGRFR